MSLKIQRVPCWFFTLLAIVSLQASAFADDQTKITPPKPKVRIELPGESLTIVDRPAFLFLPEASKRTSPQPWIFYGPTLPQYPDEAERWMHERFLEAGIAIAGIDVGEAYGSPASHQAFNALYDELTQRRGFSTKPCLFGRSRGGLWTSSWAIAHPERVAGMIGIYPVYDFRTYPKLAKAAPAYSLSPEELDQRSAELNPIERIETLARAQIPVTIIHGDEDKLVPLKENSAELLRRYEAAGAKDLVHLIVAKGQGHSFWEGFFHEQALVDFAIARAKLGAQTK
jgi:alpha-beta hydrolase superfamily lysophospholipase